MYFNDECDVIRITAPDIEALDQTPAEQAIEALTIPETERFADGSSFNALGSSLQDWAGLEAPNDPELIAAYDVLREWEEACDPRDLRPSEDALAAAKQILRADLDLVVAKLRSEDGGEFAEDFATGGELQIVGPVRILTVGTDLRIGESSFETVYDAAYRLRQTGVLEQLVGTELS